MGANVWAVVGGSTFSLPIETLLGTAYQLLGMNAAATELQYKDAKFNNTTGQFYVPVGAVGAPSYAFEGDLDTGMYRSAADTLAWATGGVLRALLSNTLYSLSVDLKMNSKMIQEDFAADISAVAGITDLAGVTGNVVNITNAAGTKAITSLGGATIPAGTEIETIFVITGGSLSLTHDAVSLNLLGSSNISLADKDIVRWRKTNDASAYWTMVGFQRAANTGILTNPGDLLIGLGGGATARLGIGTSGQKLQVNAGATTPAWVDENSGFRNRLINPAGNVYQRTIVATADDTYFADRWYVLTQTGTVLPSVLTDPEDGFPRGVRITQSQAAAQRFGFAQIIEGKNCKDLRGQSGTFVPRIRASTSQAIRYAILGWSGTEDAVTSDVVNDWTSVDYTDGAAKFFVDANITPLAVGAITPAANVWTSLAALTVALGSTFNNLIVFVWTEGTAAQNFTLDFDFAQLERGTVATAFERRSYQDELAQCLRYAWVWNSDGDADAATGWSGSAADNNSALVVGSFPVRMRGVPTFTASAASDFTATTGAATGTGSAISASNLGTESAVITLDVSTTPFVAANAILLVGANANARLTFAAEL